MAAHFPPRPGRAQRAMPAPTRPAIALAIGLAWLAAAAPVQAGASLLAYGAAAGDGALPVCDDCFEQVSLVGQGPVASLQRLAFAGVNHTSLFVNNNGLVSFNRSLPGYTPTSLPFSTTPLVAAYWADVDTRGTNSGRVWRRTANDLPTMAALAQRIQGLVAGGAAGFTPTFAQVVTWDRVGYYAFQTDKTNTFQLVLASDGLQTYALMLYPTGDPEKTWVRGSASPLDSYATVGFDAGDGVHFGMVAGSGTRALSPFLPTSLSNSSNTTPASPGTHLFALGSDTVAPTIYSGAAQAVQLGSNQIHNTLRLDTDGHSFQSNTPGTNRSLQLRRLEIAANHGVRFGNDLTVLAYRADTITRGQVTMAGNGVLMARAAGAVNGGTLRLQSSAQLQIHTADATTSATGLVFDKAAAGGTGGTLDLRGFSTGIGQVGEVGAGAGLITNSGTAAATLRLDAAADSRFSGLVRNGTGMLSLVKAGSGTFSLAGTHTYTGSTQVQAGALLLDGSATGSSFSVDAGARLGGNGSVGALHLAGLLSPGQSVGSFQAGATVLAGGGSYLWQLADADGPGGTGHDLLAVTGVLTIAASAANPFTIRLGSLQAEGGAGNASHFNARSNQQFVLASATGGITGFSADHFDIDASGFSNDLQGGHWSVLQAGNTLSLAFSAVTTPVPEPRSLALMLAGLGCLGWLQRRRRSA